VLVNDPGRRVAQCWSGGATPWNPPNWLMAPFLRHGALAVLAPVLFVT